MDDPYGVLGVSRNATNAEIKAKYLSLVKKLHPDTNPGQSDQDKLKLLRIRKSYDLLKGEARKTTDAELTRRERAMYTSTQARSSGFTRTNVGYAQYGAYAPDNQPGDLWRGPDPHWSRTPTARIWRLRFFYLKLSLLLSFLTWGSLTQQKKHRDELRRRYATGGGHGYKTQYDTSKSRKSAST